MSSAPMIQTPSPRHPSPKIIPNDPPPHSPTSTPTPSHLKTAHTPAPTSPVAYTSYTPETYTGGYSMQRGVSSQASVSMGALQLAVSHTSALLSTGPHPCTCICTHIHSHAHMHPHTHTPTCTHTLSLSHTLRDPQSVARRLNASSLECIES